MVEEDSHPAARQDRLFIGLIILLAGLLGGLYAFLLPPWQHYDEPNHFEYVWLTAHLDQLPTEDSHSPKLSRQILKSMLANGFYERLYEKPEIKPPSEKIQTPGYSQLSEPPLYYLLASLPLRLLDTRSLEGQMYAARLVSVVFLLITVLAGWGIAAELTPPGHPLRWMLPLTIAFTPAFVDLMSAVNSDAAAVALTSVYLWISARLMQRGFSWLSMGVLFATCFLMFFTKNTAVFALSVLPLSLLFTFARGKWKKLVWVSFIIGMSLFLAVGFRWDDAFGWYRSTSQINGVRQTDEHAPVGRHVFLIQSGAEATPRHFPEVFQHIPAHMGSELAGKSATFGYWIWTDQPQELRSPVLRASTSVYSENIMASSVPTFFAFRVSFPQDTTRIWIDLSPMSGIKGSNIYYDGLVLVEGQYPASEPPIFSDPSAVSGQWGEIPFINILRNGSAETRGLRVAPWLDNRATRFLPDVARPSLLIASLLDNKGSSALYKTSAIHLFQTFWARFAWGQVPLTGGVSIYWILAIFSFIGLIGFVINISQKKRIISLELCLVFGLLVIQYFLMALTRGGAYLPVAGFYIPVARHLYPVVIANLIFINIGWLEIFSLINRLGMKGLLGKTHHEALDEIAAPSGWNNFYFFGYILFFLAINVLSIFSIMKYFNQIF